MDIVRIAIDGPAGAGKSTIAKCVAKALGRDYIDTGAMYRAIALKIIKTGTDYSDAKALDALLASTDVDFSKGSIFLDGENVDGFIRTAEVSAMASKSSAVPAVREKLVALQQAMGKRKSLVMDGRDIASKVFPDAEVKFYVTASSEIRAERRALEMKLAGQPCDKEQIQKEIEERDYRDMHRAVSPLVQVPEAIVIDNSFGSLEENVAKTLEYIKKTAGDAFKGQNNE